MKVCLLLFPHLAALFNTLRLLFCSPMILPSYHSDVNNKCERILGGYHKYHLQFIAPGDLHSFPASSFARSDVRIVTITYSVRINFTFCTDHQLMGGAPKDLWNTKPLRHGHASTVCVIAKCKKNKFMRRRFNLYTYFNVMHGNNQYNYQFQFLHSKRTFSAEDDRSIVWLLAWLGVSLRSVPVSIH